MARKVYADFDQAVRDIPHGATLMLPGFGGVGIPRNLIAALHRCGTGGLTVVSNNHGGYDGLPDAGTLIAAGQVKKIVCAFTASPHPSRPLAFEELYQAGQIEAELVPQGTLAERIRAAAAGIGAFYTPTGVGTEVAEGKEERTINGRQYLLEYPLPADYAFLRAWRADRAGNLQFRLAARNFNPIMGMAARTTIAEVEEPILEVGELEPDQVHLPGVYVHRLVEIPPEGIWHAVGRG